MTSDSHEISFPAQGVSLENTPASARAALEGGVEYDPNRFIPRQAAIVDIIKIYAGPEHTDQRVRELNSYIRRECTDDFGISMCYMQGETLPGLNLDGIVAQKVAFNTADLRGASFRRADLNGAIFSLADLTEADFSRADLRHSLFPFANLTGANLTGVRASSAVFNLANFHGANVRAARFAGSYLIGAQGLTLPMMQDMATLVGSKMIVEQGANDIKRERSSEELTGHALAGRFATGVAMDNSLATNVSQPEVFDTGNYSRLLASGGDRAGTIIRGLTLTGADISDTENIGTIWDGVEADSVIMNASGMAGAIVANSELNNVSARGSWAPGMVVIGGGMENLNPMNVAGATLLGVSATGFATNMPKVHAAGGLLFVGGSPPELEGELLDEAKIIDPEQLPDHARALLEMFDRMPAITSDTQTEVEKRRALDAGSD